MVLHGEEPAYPAQIAWKLARADAGLRADARGAQRLLHDEHRDRAESVLSHVRAPGLRRVVNGS